MIGSTFIVGCGRSGSTLLDRLVGSHPAALAVGELRMLPKNIALNSTCACGQKINACAFWRAALDTAGKRLGVDLWHDPYALDMGYIRARVEIDKRHQTRTYMLKGILHNQWVDRVMALGADVATSPLLSTYRRQLRNNMMMHEVLRAESGRHVVVDSTKGYRWSIGQYLLDPGASRILVLVRDGRGVLASMMRTGRSRNYAVKHWARYYDRALPWVARHVAAGHAMEVRYEDLVGNTQATLSKVFEFLGLEPVPVAQLLSVDESHIVNGNRMRHSSVGPLELDERWRKQLTPADLQYFGKHAGATARRLGYSLDQP